MKTPLALTGLILLVTIAVVWNRSTGAASDSTLAPIESRSTEESIPSQVEAPSGLIQPDRGDGAESSERLIPQVDDSLELELSTASNPSTSLLNISGTLVLIRLDGTEDRQASGKIVLATKHESEEFPHEVSVDEGRWRLRPDSPAGGPSPIAEHLVFKRVLVDEDCYSIVTPEFSLRAGEPLELRAQQMAQTFVRVVSASGGVDLNQVTVVESRVRPHPDNVQSLYTAAVTLVAGSPSPVTLTHPTESWRTQRKMWFIAPGYAWTHAEVSTKAVEELVVMLPTGGGVRIWLEGDAPTRDATLRIYPEGEHQPSLELRPNRKGAQLVDGLPVGTYTLRLEQGEWWDDPLKLAEGTVTVRAGVEDNVHLQVTSPQPPARVNAGFLVHMPDSWDRESRVSINLQAAGDVEKWATNWVSVNCKPESNASGSTLYSGTAGNLYAGRYMAVVSPSEHRVIVEVLEGTQNEFTITIPTACEVEVRTINDETGLALTGKHLSWTTTIPAGVSGYALETATIVDGVAKFQAPEGELRLSISHDESLMQVPDQEWFLKPGLNKLTVHFRRACGVRIAFLKSKFPTPKLSHASFTVTAIDHSGGPKRRSSTWCQVTEPGPYRVSFAAIKGYEQIPDQLIEIAPGKIFQLEVPAIPKEQ